MALVDFRRRLGRMSKWRLFSTFVAAAAIVAAFASVITYLTVLKEPVALPIRLALIAPMTGPDSGIGRSMQEGVQQWLSETQLRGGVAGHAIDLVTFDEVADPDAAVKVAADREVVGVIGPFGAGSAARARATLQSAGIPMLSFGNPANEPADQTGGVKPWSFELLPRPEQEIRFLANYVRNVLGERLVSIILPDTPEGHALSDDFDEVLQRFGTRVVYRWAIEGSDSQADGTATQALHNAAAEINDKKIAGTILLLGPPRFVAASLWALRGANVPNRIVGTRSMATNEFQIALKSFSPDRDTTDAALNGAVVTTPLLFDTAGNAAQGFRDHLTALNGEVPDWAAVLAYDAASGFGRAVATLPRPRRGDPEQAPVQLREPIRAQFAGRNGPDRYFQGLAGPIFFERDGDASLPELVGTYNGSQLVAALTQLSPIREQGVSNYLEELTSGRALYVNDRFMYKTNVVYSGIRLEKVTELNTAANYADIEFVVWFRWRGTLDPQDVVFPNAVTALKLGAPEREGSSGDLNYRAYRVRGKFYMNGSNEQHRFGTQAIEVQFHHRTLSRNNLMYVTDVLGMGLDRAPAPASGEDWLRRLVGVRTEVSPLTKQLETDRVLAGVSGWLVDRSWLAQELSQTSTNGDPVFVGFGKPAPVFSTIGLGVVVKPDSLDVSGSIPRNWLVYLAIFAFCMTVLAYLLDRKDRGHFWRMQTLVLRLVSWPLLLLATSSLTLDILQETLTPSAMRLIADLFNALWWLVPADLLLITVQRFIWVPLELRTNRRIPTVFRMIVATVIFVLAGFGIVAFVLGKTITSLLATSGLLTLILGLALQSSLRDIIAGIMLNFERPFIINDMLRYNNGYVRVIDVSWRTTRLETEIGSIIALPNGKISESEIENATAQRKFRVTTTLMLNPAYPPETVIEALRAAGRAMPGQVVVRYVALVRIEKVGETFSALYSQTLEVPDYDSSKVARDTALSYIWHALTEAGINWNGYGHRVSHLPSFEPVHGQAAEPA